MVHHDSSIAILSPRWSAVRPALLSTAIASASAIALSVVFLLHT